MVKTISYTIKFVKLIYKKIVGERISDEIIGKKSIWRSDNGAECSVEQVAIEYYQKKGFKG